MSKTKRAKSGDRWWRRMNGESGWGWNPMWVHDPQTFGNYWESDIPNRHGSVKASVKDASRTSRRADTRKELGLVKKDVEHEFADREGVYKGYSWHFD